MSTTPLLRGRHSPPPPSSTPRKSTIRKSLAFAFIAFQLALLILSAVALSLLYSLHRGYLLRVPTYTPRQILDAGWDRPPFPKLDHDPASTRPPPPRPPSTPILSPPPASSSQNLLILTPLHNSVKELPLYFSLLDNMTHPKSNTSLGFLLSDCTDGTEDLLSQLLSEREGLYADTMMIVRDFDLILPGGTGRHEVWAQEMRRSLLAKARTLLLFSALKAHHDWVLWLDSDVVEVSPSLFEDLLAYGGTGVLPIEGDEVGGYWNDVISPNVFKTTAMGRLQGYDLNNWAETAESVKRKALLDPSTLIVEGSRRLDMHRHHLVDARTPPKIPIFGSPSIFPALRQPVQGSAASKWKKSREENRPRSRVVAKEYWDEDEYQNKVDDLERDEEEEEESDLYDMKSRAYVGRRIELDGVGGVATLVRADTHRLGAVFPGWVEDHQVETEGFGILAKKLGARVVGLPNYLVMHKNR